MYFPRFSWNDYFTATPVTTIGPGSYNSRQTPSASNVYVLNCLFNSFTSGNHGGAIYCTSNYLLIESSSFFSCKTSGYHGGAIYFTNTGSGECVLHGVCGYDCNTPGGYEGQFACVYMRNTASSKNYINFSSISRCVNEISSSYKTIRHQNGKICCQSTNISMNKCYYRPGIYCRPYGNSNSVTCSLLYSTFADNNAKGHICIRFDNGNAKNEMKCCNIIRNTQGELSSYGIFYLSGNLMIKDSCILENTANTIFYSTSSSYTFTLSNCTVDKITNNGRLTTQNTVTKSFILGLQHMSTRNCHSECDSAGTLTVIPPVSHTTNKVISCHCQARISDFFSFICLFMFTFIHPNPSAYFIPYPSRLE
jgi:predicted outer membrane repeat protein